MNTQHAREIAISHAGTPNVPDWSVEAILEAVKELERENTNLRSVINLTKTLDCKNNAHTKMHIWKKRFGYEVCTMCHAWRLA